MKRILVVDDEVDGADSLVLVLNQHGLDAHAVYSAKDALERLAIFPADAVLTDVEMPGIRGTELARRLRAATGTADILLVLHSGLPERLVEQEFSDFDLYWQKSQSPADLLRQLGAMFQTDLWQVFIVSKAAGHVTIHEVRDIVDASQRNNARRDLTSCLVYTDQLFAQVLEGDGAVVAQMIEHIQADHRHRDMREVVKRRRHARLYGAWPMGVTHVPQHAGLLQAILEKRGDDRAFIQMMSRLRPEATVGPAAR